MKNIIIVICFIMFTYSYASARIITTVFQQESITDNMIPFTAEVYSYGQIGQYMLFMENNNNCMVSGSRFGSAPINKNIYINCDSRKTGYTNWMMTEEVPHRILIRSEIGQKFYATKKSLYYNMFYALKKHSDAINSNDNNNKYNENEIIYNSDDIIIKSSLMYNNFPLTFKTDNCNIQYTPMRKRIYVSCQENKFNYFKINEESGVIYGYILGEPPRKLNDDDIGSIIYNVVKNYKMPKYTKKARKNDKASNL